MAIVPIPNAVEVGQGWLKGGELANNLFSKMRDAQIQQQQNEQLNNYHMGSLALDQQLQPLKLDLLRAKIKEAKEGSLSDLTKSTITKNQGIVQSVDNTIPQIDELLHSDFPGQTIGKFTHPSAQAEYDARVSTITDSLIAALGLPKTDLSTHLVENIVRQKRFESKESYKNRLNNLIKDLKNRKGRAITVLKSHNVFGENDQNANQVSGGSEKIAELEKQAEEAIANGADPKAVKQRLDQLKAEYGE